MQKWVGAIIWNGRKHFAQLIKTYVPYIFIGKQLICDTKQYRRKIADTDDVEIPKPWKKKKESANVVK